MILCVAPAAFMQCGRGINRQCLTTALIKNFERLDSGHTKFFNCMMIGVGQSAISNHVACVIGD